MRVKSEIQETANTMRANPDRNAEEIVQLLEAKGIEHTLAAQLVVLLPIALGRESLRGCGVVFSDYYSWLKKNGQSGGVRKLADLAAWPKVVSFAKAEIDRGIKGNELFSIAGQSSEITAINKAVKNGVSLKGFALSPPMFLWPELLEGQKKSWWRFGL